jgi:hypothetical protein
MNRHRKATVALATLAISATTLLASTSAVAGSKGAKVWVRPTGKGHACSTTKPCSLATGFQTIANGDTLILEPGSYGSTAHPLVTDYIAGTNTTIEGEAGKPQPILHSAAEVALEGWNVVRVHLDFTGFSIGILARNEISHSTVIATTVGANGAACEADAANVLDSLCVNYSGNGNGLIDNVGTKTQSVRGSTVIDDIGGESSGIYAEEITPNTSGVLAVVNDIALGDDDIGGVNAFPPPDGTQQNITVDVEHCDVSQFDSTTDPGGSGAINSDSSDIHTAPVFVDANKQDYREAATSPTVDIGEPDSGHDTDLANLPRTLGRAPDMGAYEFPEKPAIRALHAKAKTATTVWLTETVNAEGLITRVKPTVATAVKSASTRRRPDRLAHIKFSSVRVTGNSNKRVSVKLTNLRPHHTYRLLVIAHNAAGKTKSNIISVRS